MTTPEMPEGVEFLGFRKAAPDEFVFTPNIYAGPCGFPFFVVKPAPGYTFQYDISSDTHKPVRPEGVIQSAAAAAPKMMQFNDALIEAKAGNKIARLDWPKTWLEFDLKMVPHLKFMPSAAIWQHMREDMVARDWIVVKP